MLKSLISKYAMKGMAALMVVLLVALGGLCWHVTRLEDKNDKLAEVNGKLEQANAQLVQDVLDQQGTISELREQISILDSITTKNAADKQRFANDNNRLKRELKDLKNEKPEIRDYLNQHKPAAIVSMLKSLRETGSAADQDGGLHSPPASESDSADREASDTVSHERVWRPANYRLQHPARFMQC